MNLFVRHPKYEYLPAHSHDFMPMLGFAAGGHLPKEGFGERILDNITVWCLPAQPRYRTIAWSGKEVLVKSSKHRLMARCPACQKTIPLGRLKQHSKVHKES